MIAHTDALCGALRWSYPIPMPYVRDARSPTPKSAATSRVMSANRAKDTAPELAVRRALTACGIRGYRLHPRLVPGRPDIAFIGRRVAIFVHGCFWHHCPKCSVRLPKHNTTFWQNKFSTNAARDARKEALLRQSGWCVIVLWEHDVQAHLPSTLLKIQQALAR